MSELHLEWLRDRLSRVPLWVFAAALFGLVLSGYYLSLGARYWQAGQQSEVLAKQLVTLRTSLGGTTVAREEELLASAIAYTDRLVEGFAHIDSNTLMDLITKAAADTGVSLDSIAAGETTTELRSGVEYEMATMSLALRGSVPQILEFYKLLRLRIPTAEVGTAQVSLSSVEPSARTRVSVLLSPRLQESSAKSPPAGRRQ